MAPHYVGTDVYIRLIFYLRVVGLAAHVNFVS